MALHPRLTCDGSFFFSFPPADLIKPNVWYHQKLLPHKRRRTTFIMTLTQTINGLYLLPMHNKSYKERGLVHAHVLVMYRPAPPTFINRTRRLNNLAFRAETAFSHQVRAPTSQTDVKEQKFINRIKWRNWTHTHCKGQTAR